jgi:hypothetical protein
MPDWSDGWEAHWWPWWELTGVGHIETCVLQEGVVGGKEAGYLKWDL